MNWGGVYGHTRYIDFERKHTAVALTKTAYEALFGQFAQDISKAAAG